MKQRTYKCDGGYVRVRIGKRNFIYYTNFDFSRCGDFYFVKSFQ